MLRPTRTKARVPKSSFRVSSTLVEIEIDCASERNLYPPSLRRRRAQRARELDTASYWLICVCVYFFTALQMAHAKRLPVDAVAAAARSKPNILREIFTGLGLGVFCESRILSLSLSLSLSLLSFCCQVVRIWTSCFMVCASAGFPHNVFSIRVYVCVCVCMCVLHNMEIIILHPSYSWTKWNGIIGGF